MRGVGVTKATNPIEIDRFSRKSETGSTIAFLDSTNTFKGWKTKLESKNAWVQYNTVDFGQEKLKKVQVKALSENGGTVQIRLDKTDGPVIAEVKVPKGTSWNMVEAKVSKFQAGIHNLVMVNKDENRVEIDWVKFE